MSRFAQVVREVAGGIDYAAIEEELESRQRRRARRLQDDAEAERCLRDPIYWFESHVHLINPKAPAEERKPFRVKLWPRQRDYIEWLIDGYREGRRRVCMKSREVGASWLGMGVLYWLWWSEPNFSALCLSALEDHVDNGEPISLFGKFRFIHEHLPETLRPELTARDDKFLHIRNPENGSFIKGAATSAKAARSGRHGVVFCDEWAHVEPRLQRPIELSLTSVSRSTWKVSTPSGPVDDFAFAWVTEAERDRMTLDYFTNPERTREDYEGLLIDNGGSLTHEERAQEYGCQLISVSGLSVFKVPRTEDGSEPRFKLNVLAADRRAELFSIIAYDFGSGPSWTVALFMLFDLNDVRTVGEVVYPRTWIDLELLWSRQPAQTIAADTREAFERGAYNPATIVVGDPSGVAAGPDQESWEVKINAGGIPLRCLPAEANEKSSLDLALRDIQVMIDLDLLHVHPERAPVTAQAFELWQWDIPKGVDPRAVSRAHLSPRKDAWSHPCNAAQYGRLGSRYLLQSRSPEDLDRLRQALPGGDDLLAVYNDLIGGR